MIRTLILFALLLVMVAIARSHPGVLPEAARSAGATIEDNVKKAIDGASPAVTDLLSSTPSVTQRASRPKPFEPAKAATAPQPLAEKQKEPPPEKPFLMPRGPAGPNLPKAPAEPVEREVLPKASPAPSQVAGLPPSTKNLRPSRPTPTAAAAPIQSPSPADRASELRIQTMLRDAARILSETELPR